MAVGEKKAARREETNWRHLAGNHVISDLGRRTIHGGLLAVGAQGLRIVAQFVVMAALARLLMPDDFGLIAMAAIVSGLGLAISELGLTLATVQRRKLDQETASALFYLNVAIGLAVALTMAALAPVAAWIFQDSRLAPVVMAMAVTVPLIAASRQHGALMQRGMRWTAIEMIACVSVVSGGLVAVLLASVTDLGYWALIAQVWVSALMTLVLAWLVCPWRPGRVRNWTSLREPVSFGLNLSAFSFVNFLNRQFDDLLVGWRWGALSLGYYNRAHAVLLLPMQVVNGPLSSALVPALSRLQEDVERWGKAYLDALAATMILTSAVAAMLIAGSEPIVLLIFGPNWDVSATIFAILASAVLPLAAMNSAGWIYVSLGHGSRLARWALISTPIWLISFVVGLPFGTAGVATAFTAAAWLLAVLNYMHAAPIAPVRLMQVADCAIAPAAIALISGFLSRAVLLQHEAGSVLKDAIILCGSSCALFVALLCVYCLFPGGHQRSLIHLMPRFALFVRRGS